MYYCFIFFFFFSSRRRHTRCLSDWSSDVCSSDLAAGESRKERAGLRSFHDGRLQPNPRLKADWARKQTDQKILPENKMTDHLTIDRIPMATASSSKASPSLAQLYWLALGTFAIGTEGFMIAPLLPEMASDLSVSLAGAGQLVTVLALTYALSSPVLTALTGSVDRRRLLIASMLAFAA